MRYLRLKVRNRIKTDRYRMYHRRGLAMRSSTEGDTLIRRNEMLLVAMARYIKSDIPEYRFTRDWFERRNARTWKRYFTKKFSAEFPVKMIQIGVYEGRDLLWCLENILGNKDSSAIAIDPWVKMGNYPQSAMDEIFDRAVYNLNYWQEKHKVDIFRDFSFNILPLLSKDLYDLIVVDGCHKAESVERDALDSLELLKIGGWIVFDDVRNVHKKGKPHVQQGIDEFLKKKSNRVKLLWQHRYCDCYEKVV